MDIIKKAIEIDSEKYNELLTDFRIKKKDRRNILLISDKYSRNQRFYKEMIKNSHIYKISHFIYDRDSRNAYTIFYGQDKSILFEGYLTSGFDAGGPQNFVALLEYLGIENISDFITEEKPSNVRMEYNILINQ